MTSKEPIDLAKRRQARGAADSEKSSDRSQKKRTAAEYLYRTERIDPKDGTITTTMESSRLKVDASEDYVKMFVSDLGTLYRLTLIQEHLLLEFSRRMDYSNRIVLAPGIRRQIAAALGWANTRTLDNALVGLIASGLVQRETPHLRDGIFVVDPHIFARGTWQEILEKRATFVATFRVEYGPDASGRDTRAVIRDGGTKLAIKKDPNAPKRPRGRPKKDPDAPCSRTMSMFPELRAGTAEPSDPQPENGAEVA